MSAVLLLKSSSTAHVGLIHFAKLTAPAGTDPPQAPTEHVLRAGVWSPCTVYVLANGTWE